MSSLEKCRADDGPGFAAFVGGQEPPARPPSAAPASAPDHGGAAIRGAPGLAGAKMWSQGGSDPHSALSQLWGHRITGCSTVSSLVPTRPYSPLGRN